MWGYPRWCRACVVKDDLTHHFCGCRDGLKQMVPVGVGMTVCMQGLWVLRLPHATVSCGYRDYNTYLGRLLWRWPYTSKACG